MGNLEGKQDSLSLRSLDVSQATNSDQIGGLCVS
jgi:hypothetical protein